MKLFHSFSQKNLIPSAIIIGGLILAGVVAYSFTPQQQPIEKASQTQAKAIIHPTKAQEEVLPTPKITSVPQSKVLGTKTIAVSPKPTESKPIAETVSQKSAEPTSTPLLAQATPTQTPVAAQTVSVEIKSPDGSSSFVVDYSDGMNVCDVLQKAKDNGKIKSVTFDDSYMDTLHSKYVSEINGFANNWTFSVNGNSPLGCSLSQPKPNDSIVWMFG